MLAAMMIGHWLLVTGYLSVAICQWQGAAAVNIQ
jgi:hypothetical protein